MKKVFFQLANGIVWSEVAVWDNEGGEGEGAGEGAGEGEGEGDAGEGDGEGGGAAVKKGKGTFTQEDVDRIVVKRNKAVKAELQKVETRYESLLQERNLSDEQREALEQDLENVRKQMRTKEEQLKHEKKAAEEKYTLELKKTKEEADHYKSLYERTTIDRELLDAAVAGEAYDPQQFVTLLKGQTKLVKELDSDGNETTRFVPMVEWEIETENGKKELVLKTPNDVVKSMRENTKKFGNLFKANVAAGLGSGNVGSAGRGGKVDVKSMSPAEYMAFAKTPEGQKALGLKR